MNSAILCVLAVAMANGATSGYGYGRPFPRPGRGYYQPPRSHAMMFSGFYGQPSAFEHQGSMSAFANKDMVFTNSFAGANGHSDQEKALPESVGYPEQETQDADFADDPEIIATTHKPLKEKKGKRKPSTTVKPIEDVGDSDEEEETVRFRGAQRPNTVDTYFPVIFGRNGGGHPGAAVAIANAFSTGKGGVASSHATAYGDPYFGARAQRGSANRGNHKTY